MAHLKAAQNQHVHHHYSPDPEPTVSLPPKFDGNKYNCRDFINQVKLIFQMHPKKFPNDDVRVGFIGTLLIGPAAAWFSPYFETSSPILSNLSLFLQEFQQTFGDFDREIVAANQIRKLRQGKTSASEYAAHFRRLCCDLKWNEAALIDQFRFGLSEEIKDLLLTFPIPSSLQDAIAYAVKCDYRLTERRNERSLNNSRYYNQSNSSAVPMEIDAAKVTISSKLSLEEKERRRKLGLCLYCGKPGHIAINCSLKSVGKGKAVVRQQ